VSQPAEHGRPGRLGWHPPDPVSLVAGIVVVALAVLSLADVHVDLAVAGPVLLIAGGVAGLLAVLRRSDD